MMIEIVLLLSLFAVFAFTVKGVSGFGEGLIFITLSLLFLDIKFILPIAAFLIIISDLYLIYHLKRDVNKRLVFLMAVPVIVGVIAGTYALSIAESGFLKTLLGIFVILFSINMLASKKMGNVRKSVRKSLGIAAGFSSGLFAALFGAGGSPIAMYLSHIELKKAVFRATGVMAFLVFDVARIISYSYFGFLTLETIEIGVFLIPAVIIGTVLGMKIHPKLDERMFKKLIAVMLLVVGIVLIY